MLTTFGIGFVALLAVAFGLREAIINAGIGVVVGGWIYAALWLMDLG